MEKILYFLFVFLFLFTQISAQEIQITVNKLGECTPAWECNPWSACVSGQQDRVCWNNNDCGTDDGKPFTTQSCTSNKCEPNEFKDCTTSESCDGRQGCFNGSWTDCIDIYPDDNCPILTCAEGEITQECYCGTQTYLTGYCCENTHQTTECVEPCFEDWSCSSWTPCSNGTQTRVCTDLSACGTTTSKPSETQSCGSCVSGATQTCITIQGCSGTQVCSSDQWGSCIDIPNDNCPIPLKEIIVEVEPQLIKAGQSFTVLTTDSQGTALVNIKVVYANKTYYTNSEGKATLKAEKDFTSFILFKIGYSTKTVNLNIESIVCGDGKCEVPFEDPTTCSTDCKLKELIITTSTSQTKIQTIITIEVSNADGTLLSNVEVTYAGETKITNIQGITTFIEQEDIQQITASKSGYQTKTLNYSPTYCSKGEERDCAIKNCPGKQTCSDGEWSSCVDIPGDDCSDEDAGMTTTILAAVLIIGIIILVITKATTH